MPTDIRKITISLPRDLVEFADAEADRRSTSRSGFIAETLSRAEATVAEQAAAEGYRYYAAESAEFGEASARAVAEALTDGG